MGLRFTRRIGIAPGLRLNLGKRGASLGFGQRGAWLTIGTKGVHTSVGIPGAGLYWTEQTAWRNRRGGGALVLIVGSLALLLGMMIGLAVLALIVAAYFG